MCAITTSTFGRTSSTASGSNRGKYTCPCHRQRYGDTSPIHRSNLQARLTLLMSMHTNDAAHPTCVHATNLTCPISSSDRTNDRCSRRPSRTNIRWRLWSAASWHGRATLGISRRTTASQVQMCMYMCVCVLCVYVCVCVCAFVCVCVCVCV
jgi:hypothetical protein